MISKLRFLIIHKVRNYLLASPIATMRVLGLSSGRITRLCSPQSFHSLILENYCLCCRVLLVDLLQERVHFWMLHRSGTNTIILYFLRDCSVIQNDSSGCANVINIDDFSMIYWTRKQKKGIKRFYFNPDSGLCSGSVPYHSPLELYRKNVSPTKVNPHGAI